MNDYKEKDLIEDTKQFLQSQYGKYIVEILTEKSKGLLSLAAVIDTPYPERYLAKHSGVQEALDLFYLPLDDDLRAHG